ncbi:MAG: GGDEF domain-containing protein [Phycisphaerales bacterium]|nr:MAG: GGDEF domain-containing protein [Phycisphaerales bacterium]
MISRTGISDDPLERQRLVIVADRLGERPMIDDLRQRYPNWSVSACETYLLAIADLLRRSARVVLACIDPTLHQLDSAVAGLRMAAGPDTKLVLCCTPTSEPIARRVADYGADDYVIYPLDADELDAALGYSRVGMQRSGMLPLVPGASMEELNMLGVALSSMDGKPIELIEKFAELIREALSARGATVVVQGAVATSGDAFTKPVLSASLSSEGNVIGQLTVAEKSEGPYTPADVDKLSHYAGIVSHVLRAASRHRQWRELAVTDECSGMPNRRYLLNRLDDVLVRAKEDHFPVTLLLFDVDDFKSYNDTFGHDAGDEIIRVIGELFRRNCREQDVVARYGGDEFAVIFWDTEGPRAAGSTHPGCALDVLERFKEALQSYKFDTLDASQQAKITVSGGLATYPWDASDRQALLKRADEALLAAKRAGKNRIFTIG